MQVTTFWRDRVILNHFTKWCYGLCVCPPALEPNVLWDDDFAIWETIRPVGRVVLSVRLADQWPLQEDTEAPVVAWDAVVDTKVATDVDVVDKRDDMPLNLRGEVWELFVHLLTGKSIKNRLRITSANF